MKKITLILALLLTFGIVAATAQDAVVDGSATATVGFDLADSTFGMTNAMTSTLDLTLASGSVETEAADGWYGWITLASFKISFEEGDVLNVDAGGVTAKIINGPMYIQIYAVDGFATDMAAEVEDDGYAVEGDDDGVDVGTDLADGSGGFTFGYVADAFDVAVHFATETGWGGDDSDNNGHFLVGADFGVMAGPADIDLAVVRGIGVEETLGLGLKVGLPIDPLALTLAVDAQMPDGGDLAYEARADVGLTAGPATVGIDFIYGEAVDMDLEVDVDLALDPITVGIFFGGWNSFDAYALDVDLGYALNDMVALAASFGYDSAGSIPVMVSATMKLIPNTTFTLKYDTVDVPNDTGAVTFATVIDY
ncbi:MAG: hypothetical protein HN368_14590 [Spirochaetales bacterium]|jgi:hypothetical protein|nr:hypothetical protein [Spirochaetales bacterium]